jgi:surface protein
MQSLSNFIQEKLHPSKYKKQEYHYQPNYQPKDRYELSKLIEELIEERGNKANLNDIDTSKIDDMWCLFRNSEFNGDISKWNVSNVKNMYNTFANSKFNEDISEWDVSKVENMNGMFKESEFNQDISNWDVSNVKEIQCIFKDSKFNQDISKWNINIKNSFEMYQAFKNCPLEKNPPSWYYE